MIFPILTSLIIPFHQSHDHVKGSNSRSINKTSPYVPLKVQKIPAKLPNNLAHGLTVQELKEMTRARLTSEVTEESASVTSTPIPDDMSHYSRQRVYSHEIATRQRFDSSESWRSAPVPNLGRNPSRNGGSNIRVNIHQQPGLSSFYSADAADNVSVVSGYGGESHIGSEVSGIYTAASSRDLGRSTSFPMAGESTGEYDVNTTVSFETGRARVASGLPSPTLSNLLEDKPFSPSINASFSGEGRIFDFAGLPASPAIQRSPFSEKGLSDLLCQQPITPSTGHTFSFSDDLPVHDDLQMAVTDLTPSSLERQRSRNAELPNYVAESVLGSSNAFQENFDNCNKPSPLRDGVLQNGQNPWKENGNGEISKLESDLNNLLFSGNDDSRPDNFPFASTQSKASFKEESYWTPVDGQPLTTHDTPNIAIREKFNDDCIEFLGTPDRLVEKTSERITPSKSGSKKNSRWTFF